MATAMLGWLLILLLTSLHRLAAATKACYYPNGDISTEDVPCGSGDAEICCPLNWNCMSDGLCYLASNDYYERHTCTDSSWPTHSCPRLCTADMSEGGNQALLWCPSGEWCCDGNRSWNCCTTADTDFFKLPDPHQVAFISVAPSVNPSTVDSKTAARPTGGGPGISSSPGSSPSSAASSPSAPPSSSASSTTSATTKTLHHLTTGHNGVASTITSVVTSSVVAAATGGSAAKSSQHSSSTSNLAFIVGLAVGIPLICLLIGLIIFLLIRRYRKQNKGEQGKRPSDAMAVNYQNIPPGTHANELEGFPIAAKHTKRGRESELYGSEPFKSPALSTGTNGSTLPQYSPVRGGEMSQIQEQPAELPGSYVPYRPPQPGAQTRPDSQKNHYMIVNPDGI